MTGDDLLDELDGYPTDGVAWEGLGLRLRALPGRRDDAIVAMRNATVFLHDGHDATRCLIKLLVERGEDLEEVCRLAEKLFADTRDCRAAFFAMDAYLELGNLDDAAVWADNYVSASDRSAKALAYKAEILADQGNTEDAEKLFREIIASDPEHLDALEGLFFLVARRGGCIAGSEADKLGIQLAELSPQDVLMIGAIGNRLWCAERFEDARLLYDQMLEAAHSTGERIQDAQRWHAEFMVAYHSNNSAAGDSPSE